MKREEISQVLTTLGYTYDYDREYNRDVWTNLGVVVDGIPTRVEVYADYYTLKIVWWYRPNNKVATSYSMKKVTPENLGKLIDGLIVNNKIKRTKGKQKFIAYTDGSADNLNPLRPGGAAYIILNNKMEEIKRASKGFAGTTTNRMEMLAIVSVVNSLPYGSSVVINTDSQYCILALRSKSPKKNLDQIRLYHSICRDKELDVALNWIKGHNNNKYNELCDRMAKSEYSKMLNKLDETYESHITTKYQRSYKSRKR